MNSPEYITKKGMIDFLRKNLKITIEEKHGPCYTVRLYVVSISLGGKKITSCEFRSYPYS